MNHASTSGANAKRARLGIFGRPHGAPTRFLVFCALFAAITAAGTHFLGLSRSILIGFDIAAVLFILSLLPLLRRTTVDTMRSHVHPNDANRRMFVVLTVAVMVVILTAIAGVLSGRSRLTLGTSLLVVATLALCWLFSNSVYALHYAHLYYHRDPQGHDSRGLVFPMEGEPDYIDFMYFAFTIGMTFQTSDVQISSRDMRLVVTLHALANFVFNIGVLAFAINVLGSSQL